MALVINEVESLYNSAGNVDVLPKVEKYSDYVAWAEKQKKEKSKKFWQSYLAGFSTPTVLPRALPPPANSEPRFSAITLTIPSDLTSTIIGKAREFKVTVNTLVQGTWAILMSIFSGEKDVVFGSTVSGRAINLEGIDSMVGMIINTLPVKISVTKNSKIGEWLRAIQDSQIETSE